MVESHLNGPNNTNLAISTTPNACINSLSQFHSIEVKVVDITYSLSGQSSSRSIKNLVTYGMLSYMSHLKVLNAKITVMFVFERIESYSIWLAKLPKTAKQNQRDGKFRLRVQPCQSYYKL